MPQWFFQDGLFKCIASIETYIMDKICWILWGCPLIKGLKTNNVQLLSFSWKEAWGLYALMCCYVELMPSELSASSVKLFVQKLTDFNQMNSENLGKSTMDLFVQAVQTHLDKILPFFKAQWRPKFIWWWV